MSLRAVLIVLAAFALVAAPASAEPSSGPRQTVDQTYTTTQPGALTGLGYEGTYHAAGDPNSPPPYMRRMSFHPPAGFRLDTSVPENCTATDAELQLRGPEACPPASLIGSGKTDGLFIAPITKAFVFHEYTHNVYIVNNANEQILLIEAEGFTVIRAKIGPDSSIVVETPTCFPTPPVTGCVDDYIIQRRRHPPAVHPDDLSD